MSKKKILIVEDRRVTARHLQSALNSLGYEAEWVVDSGEEAITKAKDLDPDLILMDVMLAGAIDGIEAARIIHGAQDIPVIFLSAYSDDEIIQRARLSEPYGYLLKPFRIEELRTTIEMALYKHDMQKRLRETEQRVELALAGADLGIWELNLQTGKADYDRRFVEMFGYRLEEIEQTVSWFTGLVHPEDRNKLKEAFDSHVQRRTPSCECEHRVKTRSGSWKWNLARGKVVEFDSNGKPVRVIGTSLDISNLKSSQEQVEKRLQELSAINLLARTVTRNLDVDTVLNTSQEMIKSIVAPDFVVIYARQGDQLVEHQCLVLNGATHFAPRRERIRVGVCLCGLAADERNPLYCENIHMDPRCTLNECKEAGVISLAALPLIADGEVLGVMGLASLDNRDFSEESVFLETLADQISAGMKNAIMHEDLTRQAAELQEGLRRAEEAEERLRTANEELEIRVKERTQELQTANRDLENAKKEWEMTFDAVPDLIAILGLDCRIIQVNKALAQRLNLAPEEARGLVCHQALHATNTQPRHCPHAQMLRDGRAHCAEIIEESLGGTFEVSVVPLHDEHGSPRGAVHVARDITVRKRAEAQVRESEKKYRTLVEQLPAITYLANLDAHRSFLYVSPQVEEVLGWSSQSCLGEPELLARSLHPDDRDRVFDELATSQNTGEAFRCEYRLRRQDGATRWIRDEAVLIVDEELGRRFYQGVMFDISEEKQAEALALRTERLQAVADLASGVAHHFNNMLQIVTGSASLALHALELGPMDDVKKRLNHIVESARFGAETVKRLQSFVRLRSDGVSSEEAFDLGDLVAQAVETTRVLWETRPQRLGFEINVNYVQRPGCMVRGRKNELFEVLTNLIKNAVEAMPEGGEIRVETIPQNEHVVLEVNDTGVGISKENLPHLFEPFFTTKGYQRTGMGLASSYGIVSRHGGTLCVNSREGTGSTFRVRLPLVSSDVLETQSTEETVLEWHISILVVDDLEPFLLVLKDGLSVFGVTVYTAISGTEALRLFDRHQIDVVICDLGMPDMNGWEVGKRILRSSVKRKMPKPLFILLTGWGGQMHEHSRIAESGVDRVLEKPIGLTSLWQNIKELVVKAQKQKV